MSAPGPGPVDDAPVGTPADAAETPVTVEVDLGLRMILVLVALGIVGAVAFGFAHRASAGTALNLGSVLGGLGLVVVPLSFLAWLGWTCVEVGTARVRVTTLVGVREVDRAAIVRMETLTGSALAPPYLVLAEGAEVRKVSRRHPEGRPVEARVVPVPGMSKPRVDAALEGRSDPDDLTRAESWHRVRRMFVSDRGIPQLLTYGVVIAVLLIAWICIWAATGGASE